MAPFDQQITHFLNTLTNCLHSHLNSKVLLPVQPTFILEIIDLLLHKVDEHVQIVFMSESALSLIEYANINLEYLNPMLQNKIYNTENPLSFQKLIKSGRLLICKDIQEYLKIKKQGSSMNEYQREIFICSHESLRLGDSVYWLYNLNKHA